MMPHDLALRRLGEGCWQVLCADMEFAFIHQDGPGGGYVVEWACEWFDVEESYHDDLEGAQFHCWGVVACVAQAIKDRRHAVLH